MLLIHLRYFLVLLVVKTVLQKKQEFEGVALVVKPYEESMKKDNHDFEVLHTWCIGFYKFTFKIFNCEKLIFTSC